MSWPPPKKTPLLVRLLEKVSPEPNTGCWLWMGSIVRDGYGMIGPGGSATAIGAHRAAYMELVGPIPPGLELDHLCRVRCCVNPAHLEPVTRTENVRRGISGNAQRAKTHCKQGHPFDAENTYLANSGWRGWRACRICHREWSRAYRERRDSRPV